MVQLLETNVIQELLESRWQQIKPFLKEKFANLTDEDFRSINGHYDTLVEKLAQRYGYSKERAEEEFQKWIKQKYPNFISSDRTYASSLRAEEPTRFRREEAPSSPLKWLSYGIIPFILGGLIGGLIGNQIGQGNELTIVQPGLTHEGVPARPVTAADQTQINNIRQALMADRTVTADLGNIQISASNGVVTLSGTVPTAQHRDAIISAVRHTSGVRQINNLIEVR